MPKLSKNHSTITSQLFFAKKGTKRHQIFQKVDNFENRPTCKGYRPRKGYRLCKMISLVQKLKLPKTCQNRYYKNTRVVLSKKKNTKYSRNETILAIGSFAKPRAHAEAIVHKMVSLGHKIKNTEKIAKTIELFCAKNSSKKHQIFEK